MKYGITAILILLSYGLPALAQENPWPPLLGAPRPADLVRSPKYGIAIQTNGYNRPIKAKKIIRTERWLTNMGADQLVDPFASYVDLVTGDGEELINETDVVVETVIKPAWYSCGPEWQARFDSIDWSKAFITIEPEPFWLTGTTGGNDWFPAATDENNIRVAILTVSYIFSNPQHAYFSTYRQYVEWELGNFAGNQIGYHPVKTSDEVGSKPPCSVIPF